MSIQGIRSFGPEDRDRGVITFYTPLTLILGPNGTGKTTVIECLKYSTTGSQPPGTTGAGPGKGAFIHDPKIANEPQIQAQVRLMFNDVRGRQITCSRSMRATQKARSAVEVKTIDGTLTYKDSAGHSRDLTSKCLDLNKEMASLMGVSKAVLENVIFCHQEDSSWPMSEGKTLKEKFDDIFASTRYVKAVDSITKLRKEQGEKVRLYANDLSHMKVHRDNAKETADHLEDHRTQYKATKAMVDEIKQKLAPVQDKLEKIGHRKHELIELKMEIDKISNNRDQCIKSQKELRDKIEDPFIGSIEELEVMIREFLGKLKDKETHLGKFQSEVRKLDNQLDDIGHERQELIRKQAQLEQGKKQHERNKRLRNDAVQDAAQEFDIDGFSGDVGDEDIDSFLGKLHEKGIAMKESAKKRKNDGEQEVKDMEQELKELRDQKTKMQTTMNLNRKEIETNQGKISDLTKKLRLVDAAAGKLNQLAEAMKKAEREKAKEERSVDVNTFKQDIVRMKDEKVDIDAKVRKLDAERDRLMAESQARTQLEIWKKEEETKQGEMNILFNKNECQVKDVLGSMPELGECHRKVSQFVDQRKRENDKEIQRIKDLDKQLTTKETEKKSLQDRLNEKTRELKNYEEEIANFCDPEQFESELEKVKEKIKNDTEKKAQLSGCDFFYNGFIKKLTNASSNCKACPLCHRGFDDNAAKELIREMEGKMRTAPAKRESLAKTLEANQKKYDTMQRLLPSRQKIEELKSKTIPDLQKRLSDVKSAITQLADDIENGTDSQEVRSDEESMMREVIPDMTNIDRLHSEVQDLKRRIGTEQARLSDSGDSRSIEQVRAELKEAKNQHETISNELEAKQMRLNEHTETMNRLASQLTQLQQEKLSIDEDMQKRANYEETRAELTTKTEGLTDQVRKIQSEIDPLMRRIDSTDKKKDEKHSQTSTRWDRDKEEITRIRSNNESITAMQEDIERYVNERSDEKLEDIHGEIKTVDKKMKTVADEKRSFDEKIRDIRQELDTQKVRERELSDNKLLLEKKEEEKLLRAELRELREQLGGIDTSAMEREYRDLEEERSKLWTEKSKSEGKLTEKEQNIVHLEREMRKPEFANAEKNYTEMKIQMRTTELAQSDLDKYNKALDWTIMSYHKHKMAEINKIIKELWRNTYRGQDIDTIEIQSDEDKGTSSKRKSYNYRVVMRRSGVFLDMRGRCSAGQKVLASLIIRLALAETFCLNCGILALDEPTTNLDRENIESLAYALSEIIKMRQAQSNFQLIVITHDEDFVELLGRADFVSKFTKVNKNREGLSILKEANVADLHTR